MATAPFSLFTVLLMLLGNGGGTDLLDYLSTSGYWRAKEVTVSVESITKEIASTDKSKDDPRAAEKMKPLIEGLASAEAATREDAARLVRDLGPAALPSLRAEAKNADPQVRGAVKTLIHDIQSAQRPAAVRKLMAIRTLGELKDKAALDTLRPLTKSTEPFVADYARTAITRLEGRAGERVAGGEMETKRAAQLEEDLWLLPANCGVVTQWRVAPDRRASAVSFDEMIAAIPMPADDAEEAQEAEAHKQEMIDGFTGEAIKIIERIGNVRFEGLSAGISKDIGPHSGSSVLVVRGQFDEPAMKGLLAEEGVEFETVDGIDVYRPEGEIRVFSAGEGRVVVMFASDENLFPTKEMIAAVRGGAGKLKDDAELVKLIESVDRSQVLWGVAQRMPALADAPVVSAFESFTLVGQAAPRPAAAGKAPGDVIELELRGTGTDAARVKAAVDELSGHIQTGIREFTPMVQQMPAMQPLLDFMKSLVVKADGETATLTGTMVSSPETFLAPFFGMRVEGVIEQDVAVPEPPGVVPAP